MSEHRIVVTFGGQQYLMDPSVLAQPFEIVEPRVLADPYAGGIDFREFLRGSPFAMPITGSVVMKMAPDPLPFLIDVDGPFTRSDARMARATWHKRKRASRWLAKQRAAPPTPPTAGEKE